MKRICKRESGRHMAKNHVPPGVSRDYLRSKRKITYYTQDVSVSLLLVVITSSVSNAMISISRGSYGSMIVSSSTLLLIVKIISEIYGPEIIVIQ